MNIDFFQSIVLGFLVMVIYIIVYLLHNLRKRKAMECKLKEYEQLLHQAGRVRVQYLESLKEADDARRRVDSLKEELASQKLRLRYVRSGLRKRLSEVNSIKEKPADNNLKARDLLQLKAEFSQQWAVLNKFRLSYNLTYEDFKTANKSLIELIEEEQKNSRKWLQNRNTVMRLFNELSPTIEISNPRDVLGNTHD